MILSTEREDPDFKVTIGQPPWAQRLKTWENGRRRSASDTTPASNNNNNSNSNGGDDTRQPVFVWRNEEPAPLKNQPPGSPYAGKNPVAVWKTGTRPCKAFEFSPDGQAIALVSEDGTMKIVDAASLA
jgi:WD40 repeat protein